MKYVVEFCTAGENDWAPLMGADMFDNHHDALAAIENAIWADGVNENLGIWDYKISIKSS